MGFWRKPRSSEFRASPLRGCVQIAFAQDLDRYARRVGADYEEAINFRGSPDSARDSLPPVDRRRPLWYPQHATAAQACRLPAARRDPRVEISASTLAHA